MVRTLRRLEDLEVSGTREALLHSPARFGRQAKLAGEAQREAAKVGRKAIKRLSCFTTDVAQKADAMVVYPDTNSLKFSPPQHIEKVEAVKRSGLFPGFNEHHLSDLSQLVTERDLKQGEFLIHEDDTLECFYIVSTGILKILRNSTSGRDFVVAFCYTGEIVGLAQLFAGKLYLYSIQAIIDTTVIMVKRDEFLSFLSKYPELSFGVMTKMLSITGRRLALTTIRLAEIASERVEYRLTQALLALYLQFGIVIPLTQQQIGEMAGTTTETTARFISYLRKIGVVQSSRGKVIVTDLGHLQLLARLGTIWNPKVPPSFRPGRHDDSCGFTTRSAIQQAHV